MLLYHVLKKKISGYRLVWTVGIAHVRGDLQNSHMTKTTSCDVCLAELPLYLTNLYHMIKHYANQLIDMCILYKVNILYLKTFFLYTRSRCPFHVMFKSYKPQPTSYPEQPE